MGSNLGALTDETLLQLKVEQRLQELSDLAKTGTNSKLKSQRGGNVEVLVKNRVKWPHEYVLSGLNKERVTYDQLNVTQGVAGFGRTMRDETDPVLSKHMLEYLISILGRMEQGEVKDYSDTLAIDRIWRANAQKHLLVLVRTTETSFFSKTKL